MFHPFDSLRHRVAEARNNDSLFFASLISEKTIGRLRRGQTWFSVFTWCPEKGTANRFRYSATYACQFLNSRSLGDYRWCCTRDLVVSDACNRPSRIR